MKGSALPASALMLPHPLTTYPTLGGNLLDCCHLVDVSVL